jgi:chromosomal replication initiation ATPase DnaA
LLIDDLEYFINKEKSQGVIIQLIDGFIKEGKIIIFSTTESDLNNIDLDEKLKLRLKAALLLRFKKANNQDFRNYVDIKLKLNNIDLKNIHKEELSSIEASNFHELNGRLLKLLFKKQIKNQNQSYFSNSLLYCSINL